MLNNENFMPDDFKNDIVNNIQKLKVEISTTFPVDVFPLQIQKTIYDTNESLGFPIDFIGGSVLYTISVATGNKYHLKFKETWIVSTVLYIALVGKAGTNKSHPLKFALAPIKEKDTKNYADFEKDVANYEQYNQQNKAEKNKTEEVTQPFWKQNLVSDATQEALADVHKHNKKGIGLYADELAFWFKNFNRYNSGSDESFWLQNWSGIPISINRKTSKPLLICQPFIAVIGTIQPAVLAELANNRTDNGFLDRILFAFPDKLKKNYWSEAELDPTVKTKWFEIVNTLLNMSDDYSEPTIVEFTPDAKRLIYTFQRQLTDECNLPENKFSGQTFAKLETYLLRFSLLLQIAKYACNEAGSMYVDKQSVQGAIKLVQYFKNTALKVHSVIGTQTPVSTLTEIQKKIFYSLPNEFSKSEGTQIATENGMAQRTFGDFVKKTALFTRLKKGYYQKINH